MFSIWHFTIIYIFCCVAVLGEPYTQRDYDFPSGSWGALQSFIEGGPTREFCTLLIDQIQNFFISEGPEGNTTLALNSIGKL